MDRDDKGSPTAPLAFISYAPPFAPKPMAATETGYPTHRSGSSELAQGKYLPRLFCEYFTHGVQRTFWYELVDEDEFPDPNGDNVECHYGIIRKDLTPKPAYTRPQEPADAAERPRRHRCLPPRHARLIR